MLLSRIDENKRNYQYIHDCRKKCKKKKEENKKKTTLKNNKRKKENKKRKKKKNKVALNIKLNVFIRLFAFNNFITMRS